MPLQSGQTLLHYRVAEKIGEGGMGAVWRARDTTLDRDVAIKVLPEPLTHDAERLACFDREAKLLASLNHPGIAAIYGFHREAEAAFLVMELAEGEDLSQRLARGPLPVDEVLEIGRQIAEALEAAHERGVIHRDLKPANIKLTPEGKIKVLDFGLAKAMAPESVSGSSDPSFSPTLTSAGTKIGMILGTAAYMSPEQARGRPLDRRTDLWSFGCVLYECLTGSQLFRGETISDSLAAILRKEVDWSGLPGNTPPLVRLLLRRCLTRDPRKRLQDAGDARIELEQAIEEPLADPTALAGQTAEPASASTARWLPWGVAVAAALVAIFFAFRGAAPVPEPAMARRLTIPLPGPTMFGDLAAAPPAVSPDGRLVVFGVQADGESRLWLRPLNDFQARPLAGTEGAQYAFWSPDSRHVAFFRGGRLRRIELATGREQPIGGEGSSYPRGASWNARGQIVFAPNSNAGIYRIDASGGEPHQLTTPSADVTDASHRWPWFLPDGEHYLFTLWTNDLAARQQAGGVYVASLSGDVEPRRVASDASNATYVPPGYLLVTRAGNLIALPFDAQKLEVTGEATVIASGVLGNSSNGHNAFSSSLEGTLVYAGGEAFPPSTLNWFDRTGDRTPTSVDPAAFLSFRLGPDALRAAAVIPGASGDGEIWIVDLARGVRTRLAHGTTQHDYPIWSRDGNRILFASQERGALDLFVRLADGSGGEEPVFVDSADKVLYDWSRDGSRVAYWPLGSGSGTQDLWLYSWEREVGEPLINFHPHLHALVTDGAFTKEGEFLELPYFDARLLEEVFRRRLLQSLLRAERLSEEFLRSLLGWVHSGFSAHGDPHVAAEDRPGAERLARYLTRGPLALELVEQAEGGRLRVRTPPDPRTGLRDKLLDPLDLIHALTLQIPNPGQHLVRYYGWYSNRSRGARRRGIAAPSPDRPDEQPQIPASPSRASWARLLRRVFEVDPLICAGCGAEMKIVSVITEPEVLDTILRHLARTGGHDPFHGRAPPAA